MLSSKNLNDKTYEEYRAEAVAQIPLYSEEWTNYNLSDPGITVLENLSAFAALQGSSLNEVGDGVKWKLLKLAGFTPVKGQAAEIRLSKKEPNYPGQKIYAQNLCFEFAGSKEPDRVIQKDTRSAVCHLAAEGAEVSFTHELLAQGNFEVYRNCGAYYERLEEGAFTAEKTDEKTVRFSLFSPVEKSEWIIVVYGEDMLGYKKLGKLFGYDDQEFDLPPRQRTYETEFSLLAAVGEQYYLFAPNDRSEDALYYTVDEKQGKIVVRDAGAFEGAELFLGNYAVYSGDEGNVLPGTAFTDTDAYACEVLRTGRYQEELEETRRRFVQDLNTPATAVTGEDYEALVRAIPGLSIHKIRADVIPGENRVSIVIKPNSREAFPQLPDEDCKIVRDYLSARRMLSTAICVVQPQYVPIHVKTVILIRKNAPYAKEKIEAALTAALDGIHSEKKFGDTLYMHEILRAIGTLDCVKEVLELSLLPGNDGGTVGKGMDIKLKNNALSYPGELSIELNTF